MPTPPCKTRCGRAWESCKLRQDGTSYLCSKMWESCKLTVHEKNNGTSYVARCGRGWEAKVQTRVWISNVSPALQSRLPFGRLCRKELPGMTMHQQCLHLNPHPPSSWESLKAWLPHQTCRTEATCCSCSTATEYVLRRDNTVPLPMVLFAACRIVANCRGL